MQSVCAHEGLIVVKQMAATRSHERAKGADGCSLHLPMAWLKDTGMKDSDALPRTMVRQNTADSSVILPSCARDFIGLSGVKLTTAPSAPMITQATMWHNVRKTGLSKPVLDSRYLLSSNTPMLLLYQATGKGRHRHRKRGRVQCNSPLR